MARCPECGGRLGLPRIAASLGTAVDCRWCRASLEVPRGRRIALALIGLVLTGAIATVLGWIYLRTENAAFLVVAVGALVVVAFLLWVASGVGRLRTRVARDYRDWEAGEEAQRAASSDVPVDSEISAKDAHER